MEEPLLKVKHLKKYFPIRGGIFSKSIGWIRAVDGVDFYIKEGETLGLVGESGCGKTTLAKTILRLIEPTEGEIIYRGINIIELDEKEMRKLRRDMQVVFQDPYGSLNPKMSVGKIVLEPLETHFKLSRDEIEKRVSNLLKLVGLGEDAVWRYPNEFSGGQRQRIGIARALATNPKFVILDEPTSALDVSVQAKVINLLKELRRKLGLTYLFISHDLSIVQHLSNRVAVMYLGNLVEVSSVEEIFLRPLHPYTQALIDAIPVPDPDMRKGEVVLVGDVPSARHPPSGCRFHTRCPFAKEICKEKEPPLIKLSDKHYISCHMY